MLYLSENLKKYRILKNLTQEDVAGYLGITPQSVSKWERGESYPDITLLPALAKGTARPNQTKTLTIIFFSSYSSPRYFFILSAAPSCRI